MVIKSDVNLHDQKEMQDGVIKSVTDANADELCPEHINDLEDQWTKTVSEEHFKTMGLVLSENSFDNLSNKDIFIEMLNDKESFTRISKHPFEWLDKKQCIKLFNILRTLDPSIKKLHEISKDGLRLTMLEWQHIFSLLKSVQDSTELSKKQQEDAINILALFEIRFSEIKNLSISEDLITQFCFSQAEQDKTWIRLRRSKWVLILITFMLTILEMIVANNKIFKIMSLFTMLSAFGVYYYHQKVYPNKYRKRGRLQMICEKLIMQSY